LKVVIFFLGGNSGFPLIVVSFRQVFVSCACSADAESASQQKLSAAISSSYHFNPGRGVPKYFCHLERDASLETRGG
jgi:hypothetical protein